MVSMKLRPHNKSDVLFMGFNQDSKCVTVATKKGFQIYNRDPFKEMIRKDMSDSHQGGIGIIEMLYETNIIALVGGGPKPFWPTNQLIFWDAVTMEAVVELNFSSTVLGVKLERWVFLVMLHKSICLYSLQDMTLLDTFKIFPSPTSTPICAISRNLIIAVPGPLKGSIVILQHKNIQPNAYIRQANEYDTPKTIRSDWIQRAFISAHDDCIAQLALSDDGLLVATASVKGTIFRIFDTNNGETLYELRRGIERTTIYSLSFSRDGHWLSSASAKGTVHIFSLQRRQLNVYQRASIICPSKMDLELFEIEDGVTTFTASQIGISKNEGRSSTAYINSNTYHSLSSDGYPLIDDYVPSTHVDMSSNSRKLYKKKTSMSDDMNDKPSTSKYNLNKNTSNSHFSQYNEKYSSNENGHDESHQFYPNNHHFNDTNDLSFLTPNNLLKGNRRSKIYNSFSTLISPTKSSVQFRIPSEKSPCISVFGEEPMQLIVLCADETLYNVTIDSVTNDGNISASPHRLNIPF